MKKLLQFPLLIVALFLTSIPISAHDFEVDGIYYNITNSTDKTVAVTYSGSSYNEVANEYSGDVVIPDSVVYNDVIYTVSSIYDYVFYRCSSLTSVTIPNSVTSIGNSAFKRCTGLTSVTIPNSVTEIGSGAFNGCTGLTEVNISDLSAWCKIEFDYDVGDGANPLNYGAKLKLNGTEITNLVIPNDITKIMPYAFNGCTSLISVTIPNSVISIGDCAFRNCTGLTSVTIPKSVTYICTMAFYGCSSLTEVSIHNSGTKIYDWAFDNTPWYNNQPDCVIYINKILYGYKGTMPAGTSIDIKDGTISISNGAFRGCTGLTSITIPNSVTTIGNNAFYGCSGLSEVNISDLSAWCKIEFDDHGEGGTNPLNCGEKLKLNGSEIKVLVIPDVITKINDCAFFGCTSLTSVTIPNSVTSIGNYAFRNCAGLTSVNITNSVKEINPVSFYDCPNLCIDIEQGTDSIGIYSSIQFTCKKVSIGRPLKYKNTDCATRYNLFNSISELAIDYEIEELTDYMFKGCKNLKVLSVGKGDSELKIGYLESGNYSNEQGKGLFYNLPLDSVYIGRPISYEESKWYGYSPFAYVSTLRHITLDCSNINKTLNPDLFASCSGLETVKILNPQISLPAEFFKGKANLKSLTLPFPGAGTAQTTSNFGELFGTESNSNMRAVTQYFEDGTNKTYYLPTGLEELILTEGCEMIPYGGLYNCNMLKKLTLPTSLYMVGDKALYGCAQIADIYCKGADPAVAYDSSFDGIRLTSCKLHVPYNSSERYKISDGWKRFYYIEEEAPLVVSIAKNIENAGVVYGINEYQPGQVAEVEAVAHSGYTFVGWYENGNLLTTDSKYSVMVTESHSLVAMFAPVLDENDVEVSPKAENVTLSWAQETGAEYYNIDIYSNAAMTMPVGSMVVDNSGQPVSRSVTAVSATIDGLSELQNYYYSITAYGAEETILSKYTGSFSTIAGVEEVMGDTNAVEIARYDIHGRLLSAPIKGINIVKMSNGSTRKEIVK